MEGKKNVPRVSASDTNDSPRILIGSGRGPGRHPDDFSAALLALQSSIKTMSVPISSSKRDPIGGVMAAHYRRWQRFQMK